MALTAKALALALAGLTVTGVKSRRTYAPKTINAADLPLSYVRLPQTDGARVASFTGVAGLRSATLELVVIVGAMTLDTQTANLGLALDLLDSLHDTLAANVQTLMLDGWEIRAEEDTLGDVPYWTLVASIEASG